MIKLSVTESKTVGSVVFHKKEREKFDSSGTGLCVEESKIKIAWWKREEVRPWNSTC